MIFISLPFVLFGVAVLLSGASQLFLELPALISRGLVLSLAGVGAVFVFSVGAFGISLGASALTCVILGAHVWSATESLVLTLSACVLLAVAICVLCSLLTTFCKLPPYVTATLMLSLLFAVAQAMLSGGEVSVGLRGGLFDSLISRTAVLLLYFFLCAFLYYATPMGKRQRLLGDDPSRAHLSGVSRVVSSALAFSVAGIGVGLCGFMILSIYDAVGMSAVSDLGFNIIFAVLLGGMPLSGGKRTRLFAGVFGSFSVVFADYLFKLLVPGVTNSAGLSQVIRTLAVLALIILLRPKGSDGKKGEGML